MKLRRENKTINGVLYVKCGTCGEFKEANADNFYRNKSLSFGLTSDCKECLHKYNKKYYDNNKEHIGKRHRERQDKNRDKLLVNKKEYYNNNKQKVNDTIRNNRKKHIQELGYDRTYFHRKANYYVKKHNLRPIVCPICGQCGRIQIHHPSYETFDKWSEVVFCCQKCHQNIHSGNIECPMPINLLGLKDESELEDFLLNSIIIDD